MLNINLTKNQIWSISCKLISCMKQHRWEAKVFKLSLLFCFISIAGARTGGGRGSPVQGPTGPLYKKDHFFSKSWPFSHKALASAGRSQKEQQNAQKVQKEAIQHPRFPCSPLPKYWSGPTVLNFAVRMGCGAFTVVWPYDECLVAARYIASKRLEKSVPVRTEKKRKKTQVKINFSKKKKIRTTRILFFPGIPHEKAQIRAYRTRSGHTARNRPSTEKNEKKHKSKLIFRKKKKN